MPAGIKRAAGRSDELIHKLFLVRCLLHMTNFSDRSLSQALKGRKGPFFAVLATFNVKVGSQNPTLSLWRNNAGSVYDKLDFVSVYGHRSFHASLGRLD